MGNYIYGQTNQGTKLEILRKNPNACSEVEIPAHTGQPATTLNDLTLVYYPRKTETANKLS